MQRDDGGVLVKLLSNFGNRWR